MQLDTINTLMLGIVLGSGAYIARRLVALALAQWRTIRSEDDSTAGLG